METTSYPVRKVDTRLYIKGLSGPLVFRALWGIIGCFLLFTLLYILAGVFPAVLIVVPLFFFHLYRLSLIQRYYGPEGWGKKQTARKLPRFISLKKRIHHHYTR